jgi:ferritin
MALSKKMNDQLNAQIGHELAASQTYLAMACQFEGMGLSVMAQYFRKQSDEERTHALKIVDYILNVGGTVRFEALAAPKAGYSSVEEAVKTALGHERTVTGQINDLVALSEKEKDYATRSLLNWFVDEQVEEESTMSALLARVQMAGKSLLQLEAFMARFMSGEAAG